MNNKLGYMWAPVYNDFWKSNLVEDGVNMLRIYSNYAPLDSLGFLGGFYRVLVLDAVYDTYERPHE